MNITLEFDVPGQTQEVNDVAIRIKELILNDGEYVIPEFMGQGYALRITAPVKRAAAILVYLKQEGFME